MLKEYPLNPAGQPRLILGRSGECDIKVECSGVSGIHGKFKWINGRLYYADVGSTNGTYINKPGKVYFERQSKNYVPLADGDFISIHGKGNDAKNSFILLYTEQDDGAQWAKVDIGNEKITIGRSMNSDIVVHHIGASRQHAEITRYQDGHVIRDLSSMNGVFLNGVLIQQAVKLKDNDLVTILNMRIIYHDGFLYYRSRQNGVSLSVRNVYKKVNNNRYILQDVNLDIGSNEFVAIIGGSGAGKSTVMNAISGFDREITGQISCDGMDMRKDFSTLKNIIGYVPQEDIIYNNLTLRRMLYYTAKLKMPKDVTSQEIDARISKVLDMVELSAHQNTFIRKLSGGQKKRASIAVELLADPSLFFLDEPTSGLDPGTEKNLMQTLNRLAKLQGKTIIMVTHTTQNLHLCDKIVFMGPGGKLCFCGTVDEARIFFQTENLVDMYNMIAADTDRWAGKWKQQQMAEGVMQTGIGHTGNTGTGQARNSATSRQATRSQVGFFRQWWVLTLRYFEIIKNDWQCLLMSFLQPVIIALLIKVVATDDVFDIYESTKSILFSLSCAGIWIGLFNSIQEICKERNILRREYMSNLKLPAYVLSKFNVQLIVTMLQAFIMMGIFTLTVGHEKKGLMFEHVFFEKFLLMWMTIYAATALGFAISAMVRSADKAMVMAPFVLIVQLLFSGILFNLEGMSEHIADFTISKWSVEGFGSIAHLNKLQMRFERDHGDIADMIEDLHTAESAFKHTLKHLSHSYIVLAVMILVCCVLCMIVLRSLSKDRR
ncbi:MAG: FHA domain-containing protein [Lachnospiraceae bacterium]|nr:FHA domain-containing protein [Lachnospiraceae bacterium]